MFPPRSKLLSSYFCSMRSPPRLRREWLVLDQVWSNMCSPALFTRWFAIDQHNESPQGLPRSRRYCLYCCRQPLKHPTKDIYIFGKRLRATFWTPPLTFFTIVWQGEAPMTLGKICDRVKVGWSELGKEEGIAKSRGARKLTEGAVVNCDLK